MNRLVFLVTMTLGSALGWWIGQRYGVGIAFLLSTVGSFAGIYAGWRIRRDLLS